MALFIRQNKPKDYDCGYNIELMIESVPHIEDEKERKEYVDRIISIIRNSHKNWVLPNGDSPQAWDHFFELASYKPADYNIDHPFGYPPEEPIP